MVRLTKLFPGATNNAFLDSLPAASAAYLVPKCEEVDAQVGAPVATAGEATEFVVFPIGGVVSAVATMRDGTGVEVTVIGREGFFGIHLALGDDKSPNEAMVQIPGPILKMSSSSFMLCLRDDAALRQRALLYAQATIATLGQLSACNRLHPINERCARWLLMAHDRVAGDEFLLTHEYLATMLGVRRPGVSVAAGTLDEAGFIAYRRGRIVVRDRAGLETATCECYATLNNEAQRLLGYDVRKVRNRANSGAHD